MIICILKNMQNMAQMNSLVKRPLIIMPANVGNAIVSYSKIIEIFHFNLLGSVVTLRHGDPIETCNPLFDLFSPNETDDMESLFHVAGIGDYLDQLIIPSHE